MCTTARCGCTAFAATFSCGCGASWSNHATVVETRDERVASGRPVDNLLGGGAGYEALGGITSFSSLADGAALPKRPCCRVLPRQRGSDLSNCAGYEVAALGLGAELMSPPAAPRLPEQLAPRATGESNSAGAGIQPEFGMRVEGKGAGAGVASDSASGGALSRLKASRAAARSLAATAADGPAGAAAPPPPSPPASDTAESYAERRRAAAKHASELAAARRAAAEAAEARAIAELPELEQLHRLSLARDRAARR